MRCENWDAERFQREHFRFGMRDPEEINKFLVTFRMPRYGISTFAGNKLKNPIVLLRDASSADGGIIA